MKRFPAVILIGLAVLASACFVSWLVRANSATVLSDSTVNQTRPAEEADGAARRVLVPDAGGAQSDPPAAAIPRPVDLPPPPVASNGPPVVSNSVDGSLFGPALFERPPTDAADQRRMLEDMLWRFDAAAPLLLRVADAARDRARLVFLLRRIALGQTIPADVVESMVRQFDQREQVVMERLARQYRLHVSRVFRREAQRRADRLEAWDDAMESWRQAGSPRTQRHELTTWLLAGIENSTPGSIRAAPPTPGFSFVPDVSSTAVARPVVDSPDEPPTAPAARPARLAIGPPLAPPAFLVARGRASGLARLPRRRARPAPYGDAWREAPGVGRVGPAPYRTREGGPLSPRQPNVDERQVVSRPDPTAGTALPDRQARTRTISLYRPHSALPRGMDSANLPARRWTESPSRPFPAAVERLPTPISRACPPLADDWSEPLGEPQTPPEPVTPELLAGHAAPSRERRAPTAKPIHFARFTAPLETDWAPAIARRRTGLSITVVGRSGIPSVHGGASGRIPNPSYDRYSLVVPHAQERSLIPKAASSERSRAVVATAAVPARQRQELEIDVLRRPLARSRPEAAPAGPLAAWPARLARRRPLSPTAEFALRPGACDHLVARAAERGDTAGGLDLTSLTRRPSGPLSGSGVAVNRDEVAARIAGVNLALRAMAAELDQGRAWNATRLASSVERLRELCVRQGDLRLYLRLMEEHERDLIGRLESPRSIITRLGTRIYEARRGVLGGQFTGGDREREVELSALDVLSRRLVELPIE